jgi:MPBQ/MSBQ methyltransferase
MLSAATASVAAPALTGGALRLRAARVDGVLVTRRATRVASKSALRIDAMASADSVASSAPARLSLGELAKPVLKSHGSTEVAQLSANVFAAPNATNPYRVFKQGVKPEFMVAAVVFAAGVVVKHLLDTPSRAYVQGPDGASVGTVGEEYDAWTEEGILEYYWGEHIHLGYYTDEDMAKGAGTLLGCRVKNFIEAKFDFVDKMLEWSECPPNPARVLDVGCGIGGTSRHLAKALGEKSQVQGITLSPNQVARATELAKAQGVSNASFQVMNALAMDFPDNTFDLVWACESGEHMPDKKKYVQEMIRVLKPGGTIVIATWCQRETPPAFTAEEESNLKFLYEEWAHPYFVSIEEYVRLMEGTNAMASVGSANWVKETIRSWRHSIWVGVYDPWPVIKAGPRIWWKTVREIVTLERMHRAFDCDLMTYGMMKGKKATPVSETSGE